MIAQLTHRFFLVLCVFTLFSGFAQSKKGKISSNDEEQIKLLIERETKAFFEIDRKTWEDSWAHVPYAFWSFADTTDVNSFSGWDEINKGFNDYFVTSKPSEAKINRQWLHVKVTGNLAYVRFTQLVNDNNIVRPGQAEIRVLEKINGTWKIICVSVIAIQKNSRPVR